MYSDKKAEADRVLESLNLLEDLAAFDASVVSTVHAGLDIDGSDIDVICRYHDQPAYVHRLQTLPGLTGPMDMDIVIESDHVLASFEREGLVFELYACKTPVAEQAGYQHFQVMKRLVNLGGQQFQSNVRYLKQQGLKTEPAIAEYLQLKGDPYHSVLQLYELADAELVGMLRPGMRPRIFHRQ